MHKETPRPDNFKTKEKKPGGKDEGSLGGQ